MVIWYIVGGIELPDVELPRANSVTGMCQSAVNIMII